MIIFINYEAFLGGKINYIRTLIELKETSHNEMKTLSKSRSQLLARRSNEAVEAKSLLAEVQPKLCRILFFSGIFTSPEVTP